MRSRNFISVVLLGGAFLTACSDAATSPEAEAPNVSAAVKRGEKFVKVAITSPTAPSISLGVGATAQITSKLYYNRGGTLKGAPYVAYSSSDPCVATVTSAYPSWGLVKGVKGGTVQIYAEAWGKADTITVTVEGSDDLDPSCGERRAAARRADESFGLPAGSYAVKAGEKLTKLVLFAPKAPVVAGQKVTLVAELWYSGGGKLLANRYVGFRSTAPSVASVATGGVVRGVAPSTANVIVRLGTMADTVPVTVVQ
jgi:uncharacterized protein YjdB